MRKKSTATTALMLVMCVVHMAGCFKPETNPPEQAPGEASGQVASASGSILSVYANDTTTWVGHQVQVTAIVTATGDIDQSLTWTMDSASRGTITTSGLYTAPSTTGRYKVWATSKADPTKRDYCWISVTQAASGNITRVFANDASVDTGAPVQLTAEVTSTGTIDKSITWTIDPGLGGGTITPTGVYTAPATGGTYKVWAASNADPAMKDYCWVTVRQAGSIVSVSANDASVETGKSVQLTASVTSTGTIDRSITWTLDAASLGTLAASGIYTAPLAAGTYKLWATSNADPTKKDYCWVRVTAASQATPTPAPNGSITSVYANDASVVVGKSVQLTATITALGSIDQSVAWTLDSTALGTVTAQGVYTAPSAAGQYKAWATSKADPTKKDYCWVTVSSETSAQPAGAARAFPGCEGSGCDSVGGRGGTVYKVTTLADSGPGSLRACVQASGPRTCIFTIGGKIQTNSEMRVTNPYLTVAGQTAPGGGIEVVGLFQGGYVFVVQTHDVVVRYVRFFNNANPPCDAGSQGCGVASIVTPAENVVLDHITTAYTQDENLTVWSGYRPSPNNITVSWGLNAYPLADHPAGTCIGGTTAAESEGLLDIDFHHNYYASVGHRIFMGGAKRVRWAYNIALNYSWYALRTGNGVTDDIVGNIYRCGPQTDCSFFPFTLGNESSFPAGTPSIYLHNNVWKTASNGVKVAGDLSDAAQWPATVCMVENSSVSGSCSGTAPASYRRMTAVASSARGSPIASGTTGPYSGFVLTANGSNLEVAMFDSSSAGDAARGTPYGPVGPSRRLDCNGNFVNNVDGLLQRAITEYIGGGSPTYAPAGGGPRPVRQTDLCWAPGACGIPSLASGTACADSDSDGMPDGWESRWGLNPGIGSGEDGPNGHKLSVDYTNLEMYLNGFKGF